MSEDLPPTGLENLARAELENRLEMFGFFMSSRDSLVRAAIRAGISKAQINQRTGMSRSTIDRILGDEGRTWIQIPVGGKYRDMNRPENP